VREREHCARTNFNFSTRRFGSPIHHNRAHAGAGEYTAPGPVDKHDATHLPNQNPLKSHGRVNQNGKGHNNNYGSNSGSGGIRDNASNGKNKNSTSGNSNRAYLRNNNNSNSNDKYVTARKSISSSHRDAYGTNTSNGSNADKDDLLSPCVTADITDTDSNELRAALLAATR
jgi:hypothetical protein